VDTVFKKRATFEPCTVFRRSQIIEFRTVIFSISIFECLAIVLGSWNRLKPLVGMMSGLSDVEQERSFRAVIVWKEV
jgi:hypothetical protein